LLIRTHLNLGNAAILWGRYEDARQRLSAGLALVDAGSFPRLDGKIRMSLAEHAWLTGNWAGLEQQVEEFLDAEDVEPIQTLGATCLAGRLHSAIGPLRRAEEHLERALAQARQLGAAEEALEPAAALGRLWLVEGRVAEVLRLTEEPIEPIVSKGIWIFATNIAPVRVEALLAAGKFADAAALVTAYEQGLRGRDVPAAAAGLAMCWALLVEARGEPAAPWWALAAQAWERLPRWYDGVLAREREAYCLLAAGRTDAGLPLLTGVWQRLSGQGAKVDADRVSRRLREHGVDVRRPWRGGRRGYGGRPSPRELEVIRLVLAGKTNREIAESLHKSPRTVAGQLASVMRKLGVSSRTELAVRVVEDGLLAGDGDG
jgi:DNA-binding CsgD family transcriptional regulator